MKTQQLLAGTGRVDITPAPGTPQGGWGAQTHQRGVAADMPFYATALALVQGNERVVIVDADAIGFDTEWTGKILSAVSGLTGLPPERIRFSCTHTHSGPNTFRLANISEGLDMAASYLESLPHRIAGAAWQACQNLEPVHVAAASGKCGISVNRRVRLPDGRVIVGQNLEGEPDRTLRVVRFDGLDEKPVAIIMHYACHGTTMGWQCRYFTPDFPGPARQVVEQQMGCGSLFLQGAAADQGPRVGFTGDLGVYHRLGRELGLEAAKIATEIDTLTRRQRFAGVMPSGANIALYEYERQEPEVPVLRVTSRTIRLPLKAFEPPQELEAELGRLRAEAERCRSAGDVDGLRLANALATQAAWRLGNAQRYFGKQATEWPMQAIRVGPVAFLSIAGEPFSAIGRRIASQSPFRHTLFSGYSNGGFGYIPERQAYDAGGYEIEATPFSADAADVVVREGAQLLRELAEEKL
jgi:hypothetical protein